MYRVAGQKPRSTASSCHASVLLVESWKAAAADVVQLGVARQAQLHYPYTGAAGEMAKQRLQEQAGRVLGHIHCVRTSESMAACVLK